MNSPEKQTKVDPKSANHSKGRRQQRYSKSQDKWNVWFIWRWNGS